MRARKIMAILWPAFLTACILQMVVFALVDPSDLHWSGAPLALTRQALYTAAFFVFWVICTLASAMTALLCMPAQEVNESDST